MLPVFPGSHSDTVPPDSIPNSEVKRISADGSVGLPHVRVGHCQVPIKKNPPNGGFFSFGRKKKWGQSTLIPTPPAKPQIGVRVLYYPDYQNRVKVPMPSSAVKSEKCTLTPLLKCVSLRLLFLPTSSHCESFIYRLVYGAQTPIQTFSLFTQE